MSARVVRGLAGALLVAGAGAFTLPALAHDGTPGAPSASVSITGMVDQKMTLSVDELRALPAARIVELKLPANGPNGQGALQVVRGVRLRDLIDQAKIVATDHNTVKKIAIIVSATDGYKAVFSWSELFNSDAGEQVLVVFARDGKPLGANEGPLALVSGKDSRPGPRHVKWLQAVEVRQIVD